MADKHAAARGSNSSGILIVFCRLNPIVSGLALDVQAEMQEWLA
jgi:hypothetical protein